MHRVLQYDPRSQGGPGPVPSTDVCPPFKGGFFVRSRAKRGVDKVETTNKPQRLGGGLNAGSRCVRGYSSPERGPDYQKKTTHNP